MSNTGESFALALNSGTEGPCVEVPASSGVNSNLNTWSPPGSSSNLLNSAYVISGTKGSSAVEESISQILVELRAINLSQEEARRETKDQFTQLNTHLTLLSSRVSQVEKRVSDLEDAENRIESTTSRIQYELAHLQLKLDKAENWSWRSNLRFVGSQRGLKQPHR
ncbi:hypothetical protein NDU88_008669 [Pleurodeles waltl]|uniref:Uncharacterized protein n=1 Tax=Pleurodeles waltl TaxID=8319 RepID=A0AAV7RXJ6_PLEWA|nr:hypothetical protein NDU88_008669 [Pleurodeles waltl]